MNLYFISGLGADERVLVRFCEKAGVKFPCLTRLLACRFGYLTFIRIFKKNTPIMTTKLTLTVEKAVIERAKSYAKVSGKSLSELIEQYLETLTQENNTQPISPKLKKLIGAVKLPKDFDEKKELQNYLEKKYL